jgi:hypothetical protein
VTGAGGAKVDDVDLLERLERSIVRALESPDLVEADERVG